ncbi:hypothetical protein CLIB1423_07S00716 [[Candida] railenensis]|uniref:Uncharacterized protein n=1 Tax=[Candida] railenensis TaxID=45579 RepID=A0A9P0VY31_9ASCO|nr:hypothetical protein CLIB1423_07S00716 [[Candida] railenensis]
MSSVVAKRFFNSTRTVKFQTKGFNWFPLNKYPQVSTVAQKKWAPTNGNSFRSFAEYRLQAVNQSPLAVRTKSTSTAQPKTKSA